MVHTAQKAGQVPDRVNAVGETNTTVPTTNQWPLNTVTTLPVLSLIPILALIGSRTLDFREFKCPFRGPKILMEITTTSNLGNMDTNLIIIFIFMLFCPN